MRVVKNKILIFISFLDRMLAVFVSKMIRRSSNSERVLLIPAASIDGGFGEDIMVKGFLNLCHYPVTICERKIETRSFWSQRIAFDERYNGYFPCLKMLSLIMQHSELHVIGADILDGVYATNMFRFAILKMAHNMGLHINITGFSVRKDISEYFISQIKQISKYSVIKLRDVDSYNRMIQILPADRLKQVADIAFMCDKPANNFVDSQFKEWVVQQREKGRKLLAYCPNTIQAKLVGLADYLSQQQQLLNAFEKKGYSIVFLYHDLRKYALNMNDKDLSAQIFVKFQENGYFVGHIKDGYTLKSYIEYVEFTVTGRMHFGISGYTMLKPMFGICYFNKFEGLQKMFGIEPDISLIDFDNIPNNISRVDRFLDNLENLDLAPRLNEIRIIAAQNY